MIIEVARELDDVVLWLVSSDRRASQYWQPDTARRHVGTRTSARQPRVFPARSTGCTLATCPTTHFCSSAFPYYPLNLAGASTTFIVQYIAHVFSLATL
jgi:hypothetical protein